MANAARLEVTFPFGGKDYIIKPTFALIAGVEAATGMSCTALAVKFWANDPTQYASLTLTATAIYTLIRQGSVEKLGKEFTPEYVGNVLMEDGCTGIWPPLGDFLSRAVKGHKEHIRIAEEEARKAEEAGETVRNPPGEGETADATSKTG